MFFFKLGLLTCVIYAFLTLIFETVLWIIAYFWGLGVISDGEHSAFSLYLKSGAIFFVIWLTSFGTAWHFVHSARLKV
jgi:hypothetical protein